MDDVKTRIEELLLTYVSDAYDCKPGTADRQREIENVNKLTELLIKERSEEARIETEMKKLQIDQDHNDIESERYRDEHSLKIQQLEADVKESKKRFIGEIVKIVLVGTAVPVAMMVDEHAGDLLTNRVFKFWSKPRI